MSLAVQVSLYTMYCDHSKPSFSCVYYMHTKMSCAGGSHYTIYNRAL